MVVGIISDLHDNIKSWEIILKQLPNLKAEALLNCGDTCAPATLRHLSQTFSGDIYTVFGNVADKELEAERAKDMANVHHFGEQADFMLDNRHIALTHYPKIAKELAASGEFDLVCYGHDHLKVATPVGKTLLLNPGTAGGLFQYPTFATVNLQTMQHTFHDITL